MNGLIQRKTSPHKKIKMGKRDSRSKRRAIPLLFSLSAIMLVAPIGSEIAWANAKERYVTGIPVPLSVKPERASRKNLQLIPAGDQVTLTSAKSRNGFVQIITASGITGWLPERYLSKQPLHSFPSNQAKEMQQNRLQLELENSRLKKQLGSTKQEKSVLESELKEAAEHNRRQKQKLQSVRYANADALKTQTANHALRDRIRAQQRELEGFRQENNALKDRKERDWFLTGGGVAVIGILIGMLLSRSQSTFRKKPENWNQLNL